MQLAKLAKTIAAYFISQNIIAEKDRQIYEYGFALNLQHVLVLQQCFLLILLQWVACMSRKCLKHYANKAYNYSLPVIDKTFPSGTDTLTGISPYLLASCADIKKDRNSSRLNKTV